MKKLFVRLINKIKNFRKSKKRISNAENRSEKIVALRLEKKSDIERWSLNEELYEDWDERTKILGDYIYPKAAILEFGAGNMVLKNYLKNYSKYTPSDILKRYEETVVCDLNEPISVDLSEYDTIVFSGVLEYVYDIENVFRQIKSHTQQIVLSYCCSDIVKLTREKNGWLSDYTRSELEQIFKMYDFEIENYTEWRQQSIYNLNRIL